MTNLTESAREKLPPCMRTFPAYYRRPLWEENLCWWRIRSFRPDRQTVRVFWPEEVRFRQRRRQIVLSTKSSWNHVLTADHIELERPGLASNSAQSPPPGTAIDIAEFRCYSNLRRRILFPKWSHSHNQDVPKRLHSWSMPVHSLCRWNWEIN